MKRPASESVVSTLKAFIDMGLWVVSLYAAAWVRLDLKFRAVPDRKTLSVMLLAMAVQAVLGLLIGLYRFRWTYGSFHEASAVVQVAIVNSIVLFAFASNMDKRPIPRSATLAGGVVAILGMCGVRYLVRFLRERWLRPDPDHSESIRTLVFGAGAAGEQVIRSMLRDPQSRYVPVAILDDDPNKKRLTLQGVRVRGTQHDLVEVAEKFRAGAVVVAAPSMYSEDLLPLTQQAESVGLLVKIVPAVSELIDGKVGVGDIRDVTEADLLGRHQIKTNVDEIAGYLRGRRVLVTGAGGSIGSELCRQIHRFSPSELMMLDRDESALHAVQLSIEGRALLDDRSVLLGDIRDAEWMNQLFSERRPEVVFHAAALKHLPLLEQYPAEAIKTNVFGSLNVLDVSMKCGVEKLVNISTDKAANPSSVLGYSKRVAEALTSAVAEQIHAGTFISVRFGNVLGSRGSFIHAFRAQIESGGPVTVTDRDVTRFFMTIPEAVELVIQAGAIGQSGQTLILDMGKPVRIADVASRMIKQSGKSIRIAYTGLRAGEKLHEDLVGDQESIEPTSHPSITSARVLPFSAADLGESTAVLNDRDKALDTLRRWAHSSTTTS